MKALINAGADVNVKKYTFGDTALIYAAQNGHTDIVELIQKKIDAGADPMSLGEQLIKAAVQDGHMKQIEGCLLLLVLI